MNLFKFFKKPRNKERADVPSEDGIYWVTYSNGEKFPMHIEGGEACPYELLANYQLSKIKGCYATDFKKIVYRI